MNAIPGRRTEAERLHGLDALRAAALLLGVALHATQAFLPNVRIWVLQEQPSLLLALLFYTVHIFRMPVFFLIAGFFARMLLMRRGSAVFIRNRAARIVAPLLVFYPIIGATTIACYVWAMRITGQKLLPPGGGGARPEISLSSIPLTHLWFLYVLVLLYVGVLLIRLLLSWVDCGGRLSRAADRAMGLLNATPAISLILAMPLAAAFILTDAWRGWLGISPPAFGLIPNLGAAVGYSIAFAFGRLLNRQTGLFADLARLWHVQAAIGVAATTFCIIQVGIHPSFEPSPPALQTNLYAAAYAVAIWAWVLALTGAALRFLNAERPAIRYVADASYWIYIIHIPVLAALQVMLYPLVLPAPAKYLLLLGTASAVLLLSYELLVRHSFIGRWLNGKRYPWRGSRSEPVQSPT